MGNRIIICGGNGAGKSTLGKALAKKLACPFMDIEAYFFSKADTDYAQSRTKEEAVALLLQDMKSHPDFVFAAVKGNYGKDIQELFTCAVLVSVPKEVRLSRVKDRSFQKFGNRMLPGWDMWEKEQAFFDMVAQRSEQDVQEWLCSVRIPVIQVDGTKPVDENVQLICRSNDII